MRWVFSLLVLMNIALCVWQQTLVPSAGGELALTVDKPFLGDSGQKLQLLAEAQKAARQQEAPATVPGEDGRCMVLGGFEGVGRAGQLEQRLLSLDIAVRVVATDTSSGADHWVYIPPLATAAASLQLIRELQGQGIDPQMISEGELANGIQLGVYPSLGLAMAVAEKVRSRGYAPQVRDLPRVYRQYWLQVGGKYRRLLDATVLDRLRVDFSDLKHQLISCSGVAQR